MSKIPAHSTSYSKPTTTSSAWNRLVQVTKSASKTSRHDEAKVPVHKQSSPPTKSAMPDSSRPVKRRRVTGPQSPFVPIPLPMQISRTAVARQEGHHTTQSSHVPATEQASTTQPLRTEAGTIEVCPCLEGEPPLSDGRCSLTRPGKRTSASTGLPSSSPTRADLRTFWAPLVKEEQPGRARRRETSQGHQELETGEAGDEVTAATSVENEETVGLMRETSGHVEDEPERQSPGRSMENESRSDLSQSTFMDMNAMATTGPTHGPSTEEAEATSNEAARPNSVSSSLRGGLRMRRRPKAEHGAGRMDGGQRHGGQAMTTKELDLTAASEAEEPFTPTDLSAPSPISTKGLHDATYESLNRAADPTQLATPMSSQSSNSLPDGKENAPVRKPKRRLTLHDTKSQQQKKRKTTPKHTVQTTLALAIGGSAGMRECKVCDTVYNPFHPEDVKVHAKRHAGVVRRERAPMEV